MRTLVSTFLVGVCLVGGPALAQQHPRVPAGMYTRSLPNGDAKARTYGRIRSGDIVDSSAWRTGRPAIDELYGDACLAATRSSPAADPVTTMCNAPRRVTPSRGFRVEEALVSQI